MCVYSGLQCMIALTLEKGAQVCSLNAEAILLFNPFISIIAWDNMSKITPICYFCGGEALACVGLFPGEYLQSFGKVVCNTCSKNCCLH